VIALIDDIEVIKKILQHLDLWETRNHDPPPGKVLLEFVPDQAEHTEQLTMACDLQYPDVDNHYNNRYEDDYSQLPAEELCLKHTSSGLTGIRSSLGFVMPKTGIVILLWTVSCALTSKTHKIRLF